MFCLEAMVVEETVLLLVVLDERFVLDIALMLFVWEIREDAGAG